MPKIFNKFKIKVIQDRALITSTLLNYFFNFLLFKHHFHLRLSSFVILSKGMPSKEILLSPLLEISFEKNFLTSSLILQGSFTHHPSKGSPLIDFFLPLHFTIKWKYLVLQSPSIIHPTLDFCLFKDSICTTIIHKDSHNSFFQSKIRNTLPTSMSLLSRLLMFSTMSFCIFFVSHKKWSLFQIFNFSFKPFNFIFST